MRFNDAVLGLALLAFSLAVWLMARQFPPIPGQEYGASVFPSLLALGLGACSLVMIVSGVRGRTAVLVRDAWARGWQGPVRIILMIGSVIFYIVAAKPLGFIPTMTLVLVVDLLVLAVRPLVALLIAVAAAVVLQWAFGDLLQVPLPWGVLSAYRF